MNYLKQFKIPFKGLALGMHPFEWDLGEQFFEAFGDTDIINGKLHVMLALENQERMMVLNFTISGNLIIPCDRCMADLDMPIQINESYFIKIGQERLEESEKVLIIPETDYQIDIAELLHDYIVLSLPMKKVHGVDKDGKSMCDKETLKHLENQDIENKVDPRWDALKNIKLDNNI